MHTALTLAAGSVDDTFLQHGILGAIVLVLAGVVVALAYHITSLNKAMIALQEKRLEDKRELVVIGEKRLEDMRVMKDSFHSVVEENSKSLEQLARESRDWRVK